MSRLRPAAKQPSPPLSLLHVAATRAPTCHINPRLDLRQGGGHGLRDAPGDDLKPQLRVIDARRLVRRVGIGRYPFELCALMWTT